MSTTEVDFLDRLNRFFASLAGWCFDHRWWTIALAALMLTGAAAIASRAEVDNSFEAYFDSDDPTYHAYLRHRETFGSDEASYILYSTQHRARPLGSGRHGEHRPPD